ncbi:flavin reductase family protein [Desulfohalovibrio reitneri]|uniref:flavin reductase family protein n=1 Tax=Desulfohalovibrio reitneri TaxID=1307759 RepID=UPI0004A6B9DC|nr:flavin reductase family protein [Desulfohalovibrio reitneri]
MHRRLGAVNALYPSLTTIVGADVDGKPNFLAVAHVGILNHGTPQYLSFGVFNKHHTNQGIREHRQFSACIPGRNLMEQTDYVGLVSGRKTDKSGVFDVFRGDLEHAPLIRECPVCMELKLHDIHEFPTHDIFIGEIHATHASEDVITAEDKLDVRRVDPLLFDMASVHYYALGDPLGPCWNVGKKLKRGE